MPNLKRIGLISQMANREFEVAQAEVLKEHGVNTSRLDIYYLSFG